MHLYKFRPSCRAWRYSKAKQLHSSLLNKKPSCLSSFFTSRSNMSSKCADCDCSDSSKCTKKGSSYNLVIVETENRSMDTVIMDSPAAENDGKCKCGPSCSCVDCKCGS